MPAGSVPPPPPVDEVEPEPIVDVNLPEIKLPDLPPAQRAAPLAVRLGDLQVRDLAPAVNVQLPEVQVIDGNDEATAEIVQPSTPEVAAIVDDAAASAATEQQILIGDVPTPHSLIEVPLDDEVADASQGVTVLEFTVPETTAGPDGTPPTVEVHLPDFGLPFVATAEPFMLPPTAEEILGPDTEPLEMAKGDATDIDLPHHIQSTPEVEATLDVGRHAFLSTDLLTAEPVSPPEIIPLAESVQLPIAQADMVQVAETPTVTISQADLPVAESVPTIVFPDLADPPTAVQVDSSTGPGTARNAARIPLPTFTHHAFQSDVRRRFPRTVIRRSSPIRVVPFGAFALSPDGSTWPRRTGVQCSAGIRRQGIGCPRSRAKPLTSLPSPSRRMPRYWLPPVSMASSTFGKSLLDPKFAR